MNIVVWIVAGVLAATFLVAGAMKVSQSRARLATAGMAWTEDVGDAGVKVVGAVELLGALGLILPAATGIAPILTPLAALGLAVVMGCAVVVHVRRHENGAIGAPVVLGLLALFVAVMRIGPHSF